MIPLTVLDHYNISGLLTIVVTGALGIFSLAKGWRQGVTRIFGIYSLFISGWAFFYHQMIVASNAEWALFSGRFLHYFSSFIPAMFLHFVQNLSGKSDEPFHIRIRWMFYLFPLVTIIISFHPSFITGVESVFDFPHYITWGPWYTPFFILFIGLLIFVFYLILRTYLMVTGHKKIQLSYTLMAYAIGYTGGCMVFLPHFKIPTPWWALYCVVFAHILLIYAIIKHQLLNLKILVRRAGLLTLIYASLVVGVGPFLFQFHNFYARTDPTFLFMEVVFMSGVLSLGPFLYAYFVRKSAYFHEHTIAGLTHELKSPLGVIDSLTATLMDELNNPKIDKSKLADYLGLIQKNTSRLQGFAQNLIHAAKDQGDDINLDKQPCDLSEIIKTACEHWQPQASRKNISIIYEDPPPAPIVADPVKLHQIISNVLSNALKFSDAGKITVQLTKSEDEWQCSVCDEGRGISPENLKKVFNRFYQEKPGFKGTGIGLTIAKAWVGAHGGKIWAESEGEGKGTTVTFTLPQNNL